MRQDGQWNLVMRAFSVFALVVAASWLANPVTGVHETARAVPEFDALLQEAAGRDGVDAVVIGSSVVRHHFRTDVLDAETPWTWHNLGLSASFPPESYALAEAFLASPAADSVALLVLDILPFEAPHAENAKHLRRTWYMDAGELASCLSALPWGSDFPRAWATGQTFLTSALTHAIGWLRPEAWSAPARPALVGRVAGWSPLDTLEPRSDALHWAREDFLKQPTERLTGLRAEAADFDFRASGAAPDPCVHWTCPPEELAYHLQRMADVRAAAAARGIRCVFLFQMLWGTNGCLYFEARDRWGAGEVIELMGSNPGAGLHVRPHHYDGAHLTPSGATFISQALATRLTPNPTPNR
jgi:hypothetical protein